MVKVQLNVVGMVAMKLIFGEKILKVVGEGSFSVDDGVTRKCCC